MHQVPEFFVPGSGGLIFSSQNDHKMLKNNFVLNICYLECYCIVEYLQFFLRWKGKYIRVKFLNNIFWVSLFPSCINILRLSVLKVIEVLLKISECSVCMQNTRFYFLLIILLFKLFIRHQRSVLYVSFWECYIL